VIIAFLAAALLDVPYLPQTDALCGGASAAMVFRYWGDTHAGVEQFAALVDRRAGGIADDVLADAIAKRGWTVERLAGSHAALEERLARGEPIIVLLADRGSRYHYVVVVGSVPGAVIVHDPSWGPNREVKDEEFERRWRASGHWALSVRPNDRVRLNADTAYENDDARRSSAVSGFSRSDSLAGEDRCRVEVDRAIAEVHARGLPAADEIFAAVRASCPASAAALHELAGIRFAQKRWRDAATLARQALTLDERDAYAADVLGSSLFVLGDQVGALRAWNRIGKPTLDRVRISGLRNTRYETINEALGLTPGSLLTAETFEHARRRLDELPDRATARLDIRPDADGFAAVDVVIVERAAVPRGAADWTAIGIEAAIDRELTATLPGFTGQGETWTASWRWWANRPRAELGFAAPHVAGLPGIWRVRASWEAESYSFTGSAVIVREARTHGELAVGDWLSSRWRYTVRSGVDEWTGGRRALFAGGTLERRFARDRVSLRADTDTWFANALMPNFSSGTIRASWTSPFVVSGWASAGAAGVQHVSAGAPLAMWAGAGDGYARGELLRAHPMLDDGVINLTSDTAFGRTLAFGTFEGQRWVETRWPVRIGIAAFVDVAHAADRGFAGPTLQTDIGGGLRLGLPGARHALRVDVAHGILDGANALTIGWAY
jgi:predicted double-glycine peptidase